MKLFQRQRPTRFCYCVIFVLIFTLIYRYIKIYLNDQSLKRGSLLSYIYTFKNGRNKTALTSVISNATYPSLGKTDLKLEVVHRYNTTFSDLIGVRRVLPDGRPPACIEKAKLYPRVLPTASVIFTYRDEWPSIVVRTIYSTLDNTPSELLKEIILVDDGSINGDVASLIKKHFGAMEKVKLLTNKSPLGLMVARQRGIESSTADFFVVMDSHVEFSQGWLEPLLARLVEYPDSLLTSHIGVINADTFKARFLQDGNKQFIAYDPLTLGEAWADYSKKFKTFRNGSVDPVPVLSIQGGSVAMSKDFFLRLGGFDPGMIQWGGEQFELSIKAWMCGGRVEKVPCSKIAHVYR